MTVFPKKKRRRRKEKSNMFTPLRFKRTKHLFHFMALLVRLVRLSYYVVFNILIRQKRDFTEKQSLTGQF